MIEIKPVQEITEKLMNLLGEKDYQVKVNQEEEDILVNIETSNPGLLIGYQGRTLEAIQLILKMAVAAEQNEWQPILVNVNDYREKQAQRIKELAQSAAAEVINRQTPVALPPMSAYERRLVHLALKDTEGVETESEGEGEQRRVIIKLRA